MAEAFDFTAEVAQVLLNLVSRPLCAAFEFGAQRSRLLVNTLG